MRVSEREREREREKERERKRGDEGGIEVCIGKERQGGRRRVRDKEKEERKMGRGRQKRWGCEGWEGGRGKWMGRGDQRDKGKIEKALLLTQCYTCTCKVCFSSSSLCMFTMTF